VLRAFDLVPRHPFVPHAVGHRAYEDSALPIGFGQTASQPSLQALYMELLEIGRDDRVLEIGTGSGFQTAVLAQLADRVYSVERIRELATRAREVLDGMRISNVAILVAAGGPEVPQPLLDQLADGGRMLVPVGSKEAQRLVMVRRRGDQFHYDDVAECTFVPLLGRFGWADERVGG
jgi:protein-L-isoaspartate(D-aspartate) O-methyltransferase